MISYLFILGLGGSLHCIGMCGALSMINPMNRSNRANMVWSMLQYHAGRLFTYIILGAAIGSIGHLLDFNQFQSYLSVAIGTLLLLYGINRYFNFSIFNSFYKGNAFVVKMYNVVLKKNSSFTGFLLGVLNGIIPCGLVYSAMALSFMNADVWAGAVNMLFFGLGTLPMLMLFNLGLTNYKFKQTLNRPEISATLFSLSGIFMIYKAVALILPAETTLWSAVTNPIMCH